MYNVLWQKHVWKNKGVHAFFHQRLENDAGSKLFKCALHHPSTVFEHKILGYVRRFKASRVNCQFCKNYIET